MRIKITAIAQDVHLNQREVEIELEPSSVFTIKDKPGKVQIQFKILPFIMDVSDGFNPWDKWSRSDDRSL
jgi:hypothetical protein